MTAVLELLCQDCKKEALKQIKKYGNFSMFYMCRDCQRKVDGEN